jgi:hypothetical protein
MEGGMARIVWLGSVTAAFVVGSMFGAGMAHGDTPASLEARVAALEAWKASAGVFTQDTHALGQPWVFAPVSGSIEIRSVNTGSPSGPATSGKVTIASGVAGASNESKLFLDGTKGSEQVLLRAAKDLDVRVANNETLQVDHDQLVKVTNNQTDNVIGNQTTSITGNGSWKATNASWQVSAGANLAAASTLQLSGSVVSVNGRQM